ncbi:MAG: HEAT repeat domain-containing protein [Cyclobacteriaceae bacterium]|nr:HEAT repeat domain-containing protein [Cyclobacteriaceae bacterium]
MDRRLKPKIYSFIIVSLLIFQALFVFQRCGQEGKDPPAGQQAPGLPRVVEGLPDHLYAGTAACIECHEKEYHEWIGSDHDEAMMVANDSTVKGDFNDVVFSSQGVTTRLYREDGKFMVNTEGPEGENENYEILYTFGTRPLQQYIVAFPNGRYQCLRLAWDTEKQRWFDLYPDMKIALKEWLHWTNGSMTWNTACADCHSTNLHKNYFNEADSFHTTYTLLDVSCEACHGPSRDHIEFVNSENFDSSAAYHALEHLEMLSISTSEQQVDDCARCHSRRVQFTKAYDHEGTFRDHYAPEILRDHLYFPDGQILDENFVYSSFLQSKMYSNHVKCTNCHNPHTAKIIMEGNGLCLQCHAPDKYDVFEHHFHADTLGGQDCINCHMDGRVYMGNDYRRDHSFRVPRPDLSVTYEVPNACNSCHTDKNALWASDWVEKWYGPERSKNYADVLSLGSTRSEDAVPVLDTLIRSRFQPAIARATAVWYLGFINNEQSNAAIIRSLGDPDPTVRYTAIEAMQLFPPEMRYNYITPLLKDPVRSVRVMALDALTDIPLSGFSDEFRRLYLDVLPEYQSMLEMRADFPGGQLQVARYLERQGKLQAAEEALWKAISFDSLFNPARINLAHLYHNQGENTKAIDLFRLVTTIEPAYGPGFFSLGLLYAENGDMNQAVKYLEKAAAIEPSNPRIYYNQALAYQNLNKYAEAERTFLKGLEVDPGNGEILYALTIFYIRQERYDQGRTYIGDLKKIYPDDPAIRQLEDIIQQRGPVN